MITQEDQITNLVFWSWNFVEEIWYPWGCQGKLSVSSKFYPILTSSTYQPFTAYFPHADIHEHLSPDLLHQVIKGTFKDHIVTWVNKYLVLEHGKSTAKEVIDDIDHQWVVMVHLLWVSY